MGTTLEQIGKNIIQNKKRMELARKHDCDCEELAKSLQSKCGHDLVIIGNTTSGNRVEVCPICLHTKYATYGQRGTLIKDVPKIDVREYEISFLYPIGESIAIQAAQEMLLDGSKTIPYVDMLTFLGTGVSKLMPYYLESAREERKRLAEIKEQARVKRKIMSDHFVGSRKRER